MSQDLVLGPIDIFTQSQIHFPEESLQHVHVVVKVDMYLIVGIVFSIFVAWLDTDGGQVHSHVMKTGNVAEKDWFSKVGSLPEVYNVDMIEFLQGEVTLGGFIGSLKSPHPLPDCPFRQHHDEL